ncbi:putative RNA binding protein MSSP-2 [Talaromyces proteolyticus]|uniref:RNA binding protein MSSP-2 n=1 Tax=Talaromyces proteolyticus TaxID=1131652 RepID=A0AAD4Q0G9_9EURO|nr:putative RNA binding protein MSSP-2 [Talaromyces proteolyticus]KAH8700804.1 putative RNA binding protein MSSP-2 [Talaromyces proteolyticus]
MNSAVQAPEIKKEHAYDSAKYVPPNGKLNVPPRLRPKGPEESNGSSSHINTDFATLPREVLYNTPVMVNGMNPVSHYGQRQVTPPGPTIPGMSLQPSVPPGVYYPGFVGGAPITPVNFPSLPWGVQGAGMSPAPTASWSVDDGKHSLVDYAGINGCHPYTPMMDRTAMTPYSMLSPVSIQQPCLQYQMMKTPTGYIIQDMEVLTQQEPPIPRAIPAMWTNQSDLTLAKCLENREGITNVYIRGFPPETTDEMLHAYASRFGDIDRCKAILDLETGLCKGFAFVQFYNFDSCENCIRGFYYLGYQASFAQKSRNSRLKDLEDRNSTNIYCTNVPIDWSEADLRRHFEPYRVVSEKISRDEKTGVSKEVGFARFENRDIAERVIEEFHNVVAGDGHKLLLRFADTKAQKLLKQQSNERRAYRAGEYNYSVEVVQGSTPSPATSRLGNGPASPMSFQSPAWTPATTISPSIPVMKNGGVRRGIHVLGARASSNTENTPVASRGRAASTSVAAVPENGLVASPSKSVNPGDESATATPRTPIKKIVGNRKSSSVSPVTSRKDIEKVSPKSAAN